MRARKSVVLLASALIFACGGGGGSPAATGLEPEQEQSFSVGLVRGDVPTVIPLVVTKPFEEAGTVELLGAPVGAFDAGALPMALASAQRFVLLVAFTPPPAPAGALQHGRIPLVLRRESGGAAFPVTLLLDAEIETPSARLLETQLHLGNAAVGETVPCAVRLENTSVVTPITVGAVTLSEGDFAFAPDASAVPATVAPGSTFPVLLSYAPRSETNASSLLRVFHSAAADPLEATLEAGGVAPRVVFDYGFVPLDPLTFESEWLTLDVAPEGVGIFLEAWSVPEALIDLVALEGPAGETYPLDWLGTYPAGAGGLLNVQLPDSSLPEVQLAPGGGPYRFRLRDAASAAGEIRVRAIVSQRRAGAVVEGTLDVHVHLAYGLAIADRSDPMADAKLSAVIRTIDATLGIEGIRLGTVTFSFLDPRFDVLEDEMAQVNMLMVSTAVLPEGPLNLFLVKDMPYGGIAAATPGPRANGTACSGVVVDFEEAQAITVGAIAAHEIAQYLGHLEGGMESVLLEPDGVYPVMRHPLMNPGLPENLVSPPESTNYPLIFMAVDAMAPAADWCGTCTRTPVR